MFMQGINSKGQALIIALLVISALTSACIYFTKSVISERYMMELYIQKERSFYIAEAGLEYGKAMVAKNPGWFTDNPHLSADDTDWLIKKAVGSKSDLGGGSYKIVKESGKGVIYSVGYYKSGISVIRVKYGQGPFHTFEYLII